MGAEFFIGTIPAIRMSPKIEGELCRLVDRLQDSELDSSDSSSSEVSPVELRDSIKGAIREIKTFADRHDCTILHDENAPYDWFITGGSSWGDDPSEAYSLFNTIGNCAPLWSRIEVLTALQHRRQATPARLRVAASLFRTCLETALVEGSKQKLSNKTITEIKRGMKSADRLLSSPGEERER